ncbi:hypothetical protein MRX96_045600 [Rhipicephalus microplus]
MPVPRALLEVEPNIGRVPICSPAVVEDEVLKCRCTLYALDSAEKFDWAGLPSLPLLYLCQGGLVVVAVMVMRFEAYTTVLPQAMTMFPKARLAGRTWSAIRSLQ